MTYVADFPANERARVARLHALAILDTKPELVFDALTRLASEACDAPIALISLIDSDRQWFKSNVGVAEITGSPRDFAFCSHCILTPGIMEVSDTLEDPRFFQHPAVTSNPDIRFYAGAPITLDNDLRIGSLCVLDRRPRKLSLGQLGMLRQLAVAVAEAMAFRERTINALIAAAQSRSQLETLYTATPAMLYSIDAAGRLLNVSDAWLAELGYRREEVVGRHVLDYFASKTAATVTPLRLGSSQGVLCTMVRKDGSLVEMSLTATAERDETGKAVRSLVVLDLAVDGRPRQRSPLLTPRLKHWFKDKANGFRRSADLDADAALFRSVTR